MCNQGKKFSENEIIVHNAFNKFIEVFIKGKKSLIVDEGSELDIEECKNFIETEVCKKYKNDEGKEIIDYGTLDDLKEVLKEKQQDRKKYVIPLWHCYWIMYLMNNTSKSFIDENELKIRETYSDDNSEDTLPLFVDEEIAATDMAYSSGSIKAFLDLLTLFISLDPKDKNIDDINIDYIDDIKKQILENNNLHDNRAKNVLLYLCDPEKYPCIISQRHQNAIYNYLGNFYNEEEDKFKKERHVKTVETGVINDFGCKNLYDDNIKPFWGESTNLSTDKEDKLANDTLLKYKKAIVLYGPPGTSKSYEARALAKHLLRTDFLKKLKENHQNHENKAKISQFLIDFNSICDDKNTAQSDYYNGITHVHRLQLHPGYTYDDFIIGRTIEKNSVKIQKGYLMRLIDEIKLDRDAKTPYAGLPHILILDEINRVDISRVFGELFTAMEKDYRSTGVDLPVTVGRNGKTLKLNVPEDLYIIGTMNMIDFSLEQVDFALRRRFAWIESNYDKKRLEEIIEEKSKDISSDIILPFVTACTKLNEKISNEPSLGPAYQIGHAFFSEIVDIYSDVKLEGKQNPWEVARKVLWSISIRPTLEAYCGSMETEQKKQFIEGCKNAFIPQVKDKGKGSKSKQKDVEPSSENE